MATNRRALVILLWNQSGLTAPPCFATRMQWVEFAAEAASWQRPGHVGPLHLDPKQHDEPQLNLGWNYCKDCDVQHQRAKAAAKQCDPDHLIRTIGGSHAKRVLPKTSKLGDL
jgi:hypothetical protein